METTASLLLENRHYPLQTHCLVNKMAGHLFDVFIARNCIIPPPVKRFNILINESKFCWKNEDVELSESSQSICPTLSSSVRGEEQSSPPEVNTSNKTTTNTVRNKGTVLLQTAKWKQLEIVARAHLVWQWEPEKLRNKRQGWIWSLSKPKRFTWTLSEGTNFKSKTLTLLNSDWGITL